MCGAWLSLSDTDGSLGPFLLQPAGGHPLSTLLEGSGLPGSREDTVLTKNTRGHMLAFVGGRSERPWGAARSWGAALWFEGAGILPPSLEQVPLRGPRQCRCPGGRWALHVRGRERTFIEHSLVLSFVKRKRFLRT